MKRRRREEKVFKIPFLIHCENQKKILAHTRGSFTKEKESQNFEINGQEKRREEKVLYLDGLRRDSTLLEDFVEPCKTRGETFWR